MSEMLAMVRDMAAQLRWAAGIDLPSVVHNREFVVAGMGGSGIAGDYLEAVTRQDELRVTGHKDYGPLPGWVDRVRPTVIAISYSGHTEETLDVVDDAVARGLDVVALTAGGAIETRAQERGWPLIVVPPDLQPRAALGYLFGSALRVVGAASGNVSYQADLEEAAGVAETATAEGSEGWEAAARITTGLSGKITIVYGGGPVSGAAAQRWKTQINENSKMPAWWSLLPELDHNEIVGWESLAELTSETVAVVGLSDRSDHHRVGARFRHTRDLTAGKVSWAGEVTSWGESAAARIISLTAVGDVMSWMLANRAGVDPLPVGTIEKLKKLLTEEEN